MFFLKHLPSKQMIDGYAAGFDDVDPARIDKALNLMRDGSRLIRKLESYFAQHGLSQLRFLALIVIDREPERDSLSVSEIAERLDVSRPVVTRTLQSLESAGLVTIEQSDDDGRSRTVRISANGDDVLERILPGYFAILNGDLAEAEG